MFLAYKKNAFGSLEIFPARNNTDCHGLEYHPSHEVKAVLKLQLANHKWYDCKAAKCTLYPGRQPN